LARLTSERARLIGRIGGLRLSSTRDPKTYTAAARASFLAGDHARCGVCGHPPPLPDGLEPVERERRLTARRRAHMAALAFRSAQRRGAA
jgi:hypothetical protein